MLPQRGSVAEVIKFRKKENMLLRTLWPQLAPAVSSSQTHQASRLVPQRTRPNEREGVLWRSTDQTAVASKCRWALCSAAAPRSLGLGGGAIHRLDMRL
jgi:hypothetical protein